MKTATANFKTETNKPHGTSPVILAKIFYGTSSFFLCSTKKVTIGIDTYKPYIVSFGSINYGVPEGPGLGIRASCEIILNRKIFAESGGGTENVSENLLTQKSKGKKVQLWQFFEGLVDADKLPIANFIINDVNEIEGQLLKLDCVAPEFLLEKEIPKLKFNKIDFPDLFDVDINFPRPIRFGNLRYPSGISNTKEYIFFNRPLVSPAPAYLTDIVNFKFVFHETADASSIAFPEHSEFLEWFSQWNTYASCRNITYSAKVWTHSVSGGRNIIDMDALLNITPNGRYRTARIMPSEAHFNNTASQWKNAIDLDDNTICVIGAGENLMVFFDQKSALSETTLISATISFNVTAIGATPTMTVYDGTIGGTENSRGTFTTTGFKEISTPTLTEVGFPVGYYLKIAVPAGAGNSCSVDGLHIRLVFESNKRMAAGFDMGQSQQWIWIPYKNPIDRHFMGPGYWKPIDPAIPPSWQGSTFSNNFFYNGVGLTFDTDSKGYDYENPVYFIQYILRQILGYASTELNYGTFTATHSWLANASGSPTETFRTWKFGGCINTNRAGGEWLTNILAQCACWLYWGAEGGWNLFPINYNSQIVGILTFKDIDSIRPLINFKLARSQNIYNRYVFNFAFDYAQGNFRNQIIYDQVNKTELATSVIDYGEKTYPLSDYYFIHRESQSVASSTNASPIVVTITRHGFSNGQRVLITNHLVNTNANGIWTIANVTTSTFELTGSTGNGIGGTTGLAVNLTESHSNQIDNLYSIYKRAFKDPRWIIEFETRLSASWLEVGDNLRINHPAASGITGNGGTSLNDNTDFQIIEHRQDKDRIYIKAVEIVP